MEDVIRVEVGEERPVACEDYWTPTVCIDWYWEDRRMWASEWYAKVKRAPGEWRQKYCFEIDLRKCNTLDECFDDFFDEYSERWRRGTGADREMLLRWQVAVEPILREAFVRAIAEWLFRIAKEAGLVG